MGDCIEHTQSCPTYGRARIAGKHTSLHRKVFLDTYGYLPEVVRHTCDNPRCINPAHLLAGTQQDNMQDRLSRGRWSGGRPCGLSEDALHDILYSTDLQRVIAKRHNINQSRVSQLRKQFYV